MGRMYSVVFNNVTATAAQDLFEITPADDKPCIVHALYVSQSTEIAEAQEEQLRLAIIRGHTTSGSGGTAPTPAALNPNDPAASFTAEVNNTTIAASGTTATLHVETFNVRANYAYVPPPECRPVVTQANTTLVVRLLAAPADTMDISGTLIVEEL